MIIYDLQKGFREIILTFMNITIVFNDLFNSALYLMSNTFTAFFTILDIFKMQILDN